MIFLLSFKPSYARLKMLVKQKAINSLLSEWCTNQTTVQFVDVATCLYDEPKKLREDIFKADRRHMNPKGYDLWIRELRPKLLNVCK
jgi:lysophospholipase L1-like esterase